MTKVVNHKDLQLTIREQPISDNYKLMLGGIHTDPFGELHEKRRDTDNNEISSFVLSPNLNDDTGFMYSHHPKLYEDDPYDKCMIGCSDSDEDFNEQMRKFKL